MIRWASALDTVSGLAQELEVRRICAEGVELRNASERITAARLERDGLLCAAAALPVR